jgi:hypothetical protein
VPLEEPTVHQKPRTDEVGDEDAENRHQHVQTPRQTEMCATALFMAPMLGFEVVRLAKNRTVVTRFQTPVSQHWRGAKMDFLRIYPKRAPNGRIPSIRASSGWIPHKNLVLA